MNKFSCSFVCDFGSKIQIYFVLYKKLINENAVDFENS